MKKIYLIGILFFGLGACCKDNGSYWNIAEFELSVVGINGNTVGDTDNIIRADSLVLYINFDPLFVYQENFSFSLINSAYAFQNCEAPGDFGLQDKIERITLKSDNTFNSIPPGESLNSTLNWRRYSFSNPSEIGSAYEGISEAEFDELGQLEFLIVEKPLDNISHQFSLEFEFQSGNVLSDTLKRLNWR